MWKTESYWVEVAIVSFFFLMGNIYLGHFEERSPKWRKVAKYLVTLLVVLLISFYAGRTAALVILGITILPVIYVHGIVLPKKGINGWTGEPKGKYYEFRGWSKDIFGEK